MNPPQAQRAQADDPTPGQVRRCLNCGTPAPGNFCPQCGQETALTPQPFAQWMRGSSAMAFSRRGRLWLTLTTLLFAPGALTAEYSAGRRARYLRPLQVYLLASLVVFAAVQFFGLGLGLRFYGEQGVHLLRNAPPAAAQGPGQRMTAMQLILDHVDLPRVRRFEALSPQERFGYLRARRALSVSYFILFLVPVFALTVGLVYRDRQRHFGEHLVFALHFQAFLLFVLLVEATLPAAPANALSLWVLAYLAVALKRVDGGPWAGSIGRAALVLAVYFGLFFVSNLLLVLGLMLL